MIIACIVFNLLQLFFAHPMEILATIAIFLFGTPILLNLYTMGEKSEQIRYK
jgi:hypothetical protein